MILKINPELKSHFSYEMTSEQLEKILRQAEKAELLKIILAINLFMEAQNKIGSSFLPQLPLEIAIIKATMKFPTETENPISKITTSKEPLRNKSQEKKDEPIKIEPEKNSLDDKKNDLDEQSADLGDLTVDEVQSIWPRLLVEIRPYNHSLSVLLTSCQAQKISGNEIIIATPYSFYKDKLDIAENRLTIEKILGTILGVKIKIKATVDKDILPKKMDSNEDEERKSSTQDPLLASALEIIGGKIVE
jgi:hypothetical protein